MLLVVKKTTKLSSGLLLYNYTPTRNITVYVRSDRTPRIRFVFFELTMESGGSEAAQPVPEDVKSSDDVLEDVKSSDITMTTKTLGHFPASS